MSTFVMTLHQTDAGYGQTSPGTSARSPEIFIPLAAKNANQAFWGWPELFTEDTNRSNKFDRSSVLATFNHSNIHINMMTWPDRSDFRIRNAQLRDFADVGDILVIKLAESPYSYDVQIIKPTSPDFQYFLGFCQNIAHNSEKRWGYFN